MRKLICAGLLSGLFVVSALSLRAADSQTAEKWLNYGKQQYAQKQYDKALQSFSQATKADAGNASAWKAMGNCFYAKGDQAKALQYYNYSLKLNPSDTGLAAYVQRIRGGAAAAPAVSPMVKARQFYQAKRYQEAVAAFNQVLASNPNDAQAYQGLGNSYYAMGDKNNAVVNYRRSLAIDPSNTALQNFLNSYDPQTSGGTQMAGNGDWTGAAWRSMVLPGWGQVQNGQETKGYILGGVTLSLFAGTVATYMIGDDARKEYLGLTDPNADYDGPYETWEQMAELNHIFYIGFGASYIFTLVDAIWTAKNRPTMVGVVSEPPALQLASMEDGSPMLTYRLLDF